MEYNLWLQTELDDMKSCYQLIKTMTKFEEKTRHQFHKTTVNSAKCETIVRTHVHLHRHDVLIVPLTVLLHGPITSMMSTLSY